MRNTKRIVSKTKKRCLALGLALAMAAGSLSPAGTLNVFAAAQDTRAVSKNNADANAVAEATVAALQAVDYTGLASLVARTYYTGTEKLNKRTEIYRRGGYTNMNDITDEMVIAELNVDDLKVMSFENAYAKVQEDLDTLIPLIVQNSTAGTNGDQTEYFTNEINNNKEKLLLGLTYVYRLYDFNIGNVNIKDKMFADVTYFGGNPDQLQWLISLGGAGGDTLKLANNISVFQNYFAGQVTSSTSLASFLESEIAKTSGLTASQWFKDESNAVIVERQSEKLGGTVDLYERLKSAYPSYILPILNVSENSVYFVSTPGAITMGLVDTYVDRNNKGSEAYETELAAFKTELEKHADLQTRYLELWNRIAKEDDRSELISNRVVLDAMRIKGRSSYNSASEEWSPKVGDEVSIGVEEFFAPMNLYVAYTSADAQADTNTGTVTFWMAKAIGDKGLSTYSHELTHILVNSVWLNDYNSREGFEGEFFTRGLFETYYSSYFDPQMSLNMILDYSGNSSRIYNATPERFQDPEDLQEFTQGMMDVLYTLDYMEAQAILGKSATDKQKWFHQMNQKAAVRESNQGNVNATHTNDNIVEIDESLAGSLLTVDDLIDNNIVTCRHTAQNGSTIGEVESEEYHAVPMFSANYAVAQNDNGASGAFTGRRMAFDLLAEYGYYEGMVPYLSNQYLSEAEAQGGVLSDTFIFGKIFGDQYENANAFKKAMFARRADKLEQLKPITITVDGTTTQITSADQLQEMMNTAVVNDLPGMPYQYGSYASYSQVEKLKAAVYTAYLQETDDFTTSIYLDVTPTEEPTPEPTEEPTVEPTVEPTTEPTAEPTTEPTADPEIPSTYMSIETSGTFDVSGTENYSGASSDVIKNAIFDDRTDTWWNSTSVTQIAEGNPYLTIDLHSDYDLSKLEFSPRWNSTAHWECTGNISTLIVQVSADGVTWTDVTEGGKTLDLSGSDQNAYPVAIEFDADRVRYVRISGKTSYHWGSSSNTSITIGDLSIYGTQLPISGEKTSVSVSGTYQTTPSNENNVGAVTLDNINDNLFDDDYTNTFWNSNHLSGATVSKENPYLIVNLNGVYDLTAVGYTPRYSNGWQCTGNITKLNVAVSGDGNHWTTLTQDGGDTITLDGTTEFPYMIQIPATLSTAAAPAQAVSYVRISAEETYDWQNHNNSITIAELDIYGFEREAEEVDDGTWLKAGSLPATNETITQNQPFAAGTADSSIFRIPCLISLKSETYKGTLVAAADARYTEYRDFGGIDTIAAVSTDNGATWNYSFPIWFPDSDGSAGLQQATTAIDPAIVEGPDGTIYCFADMNPTAITTQDIYPGIGTGFEVINGVSRLVLTDTYTKPTSQSWATYGDTSDPAQYEYYVGDFDNNGYAKILLRADHSESGYAVDEWYNIYTVRNGEYVANLKQTQVDSDTVIQQNAFYEGSIFHVYSTGYIWCVKSHDGGMSWEDPEILNTQIKRDDGQESAILVSPGQGITTSQGDIVVGAYNTLNSEDASIFYSTDNGQTWKRSNDVNVSGKSSENEIIELPNGTLRMFYRSDTAKICYADITREVGTDGEVTYVIGEGKQTAVASNSNCNVSAILLKDTTFKGKPVILVTNPEAPVSWTRVNGKIFVFTLNDDYTMNHETTYSINTGEFAYSCMAELENGNIGILWEPGINQNSAIRYDEIAIADILPATEKEITVNVGESYEEVLDADADTAISGNPNTAIAKVEVQTVQKEVVKIYDKGSETPNTSLKLADAELTFHAVDAANNQWNIITKDNYYMVNKQPGGAGSSTYLFQTAEGSMTVTPDGTGSFTFKDTESGRYTMFYSNASGGLNFNAMGTNTTGEHYQYGLMLLEKQTEESDGDTLPGYKLVDTITDGNSYLVVYSYAGKLYMMFPSTGASPFNAVTKTVELEEETVNQLVITGVKKGTTQATVNGINYNITVINDGEVAVTLKVGETYTVNDGLVDEQPTVTGIVDVEENVSYAQSSATTFESGKKYVITTHDGYILKNAEKPTHGSWEEGLTLASNDYSEAWTITVKEITDEANGIYKVAIQDAEGKYICFEEPTTGNTAVNMKTTEQILTLTRKSEGIYSISYTGTTNTSYLDDLAQSHQQAAGWASGSSGNACGWKFYKMDTSTVITAETVGETTMVIDGVTYRFTVVDEEATVSGLMDIVIDFGLPTTVHVEPWQVDGTTVNLAVGTTTGTATYGTVDVAGDTTNGWDITYTPTTVLAGVDTVTLPSADGTKEYNFKVYPANAVYYEEGFLTSVEGTWETSHYQMNAQQEAAYPGESQDKTASNYGHDAAYENPVTGPAVLIASATNNAEFTTVNYNGAAKPLENCLYTFVSTGTANEYYVLNVNEDGNVVYLNFQGTGTEGRRPHSNEKSVIRLSAGSAAGTIRFLDTVGGASGGSYLHFYNTGKLHFDRCGSGATCVQHNMKVYTWVGEAAADGEIPGYQQVTSIADIQSGGKYLIVAEGTDANSTAQKYVLYPPRGNASTNYHDSNQAPSWKHVALISGEVAVGTEYITTNADMSRNFDESLANAEAAFTFTGTGVDLYANCTADTGMAMILLSKVNEDSSTKIEKILMVDTKLQAGALDGSALTDFGKTHNIPLISLPEGSLTYGTYQVSVVHATTKAEQVTGTDDAGNSITERVSVPTTLRIDGFRVYGTLTDEMAADCYALDLEANVSYKDIKDSLLAAWTVSGSNSGYFAEQLAGNTLSQIYASGGTQLESSAGAMLFDSQNQQITYTGDDLKNYLDTTSKNEVYLYPGQSLVFSLTEDNINPQIALKSLNGEVSYSITSAASGQTGTAVPAVMKANTEMYYPLTMAGTADAPVQTSFTIANTGSAGVLAVTKLKVVNVAGTATFATVTPKDVTMALVSLGFKSQDTEVTTTPEVTATPEAKEKVTEIFSDVYEDWYTEYVQYVYDNGLMTGIKGTDRFEPNANITKAQVAQVLYNMEQPKDSSPKVFEELSDVYAEEWYADAVAWAYDAGVVTGDTNTKKFYPNAEVTREQLALMMYRYAQFKKYDTSECGELAGLLNAENTSNWALEGVQWAVGAGLISGIDTRDGADLAPQGTATRAQMAAILQRFCEGCIK